MSWKRLKLFAPIMAGATLSDRLLACAGSLSGIAMTVAATALVMGSDSSLPMIVAPMGASAVLLFVVPSSPMAQPWPLIGGNTISAFVGVAVAQTGAPFVVSAALAVCLAILAMSLTRSLHPPGGAAALTAVIGGQAVSDWGFWFPLAPVAVNACLLLMTGLMFHFAFGHRYPHTFTETKQDEDDPPSRLRLGLTAQDIDDALLTVGDSFDIAKDDLVRLLAEAEWRASTRIGGLIRCSDVMTRHVICVTAGTTINEAQALLIGHNVRMVPVTDDDRRLLGAVGLRQLITGTGSLADVMVQATTVSPEDAVSAILPCLADGHSHGAVVTDAERRVLGVVTQTDVLGAMARLAADHLAEETQQAA